MTSQGVSGLQCRWRNAWAGQYGVGGYILGNSVNAVGGIVRMAIVMAALAATAGVAVVLRRNEERLHAAAADAALSRSESR